MSLIVSIPLIKAPLVLPVGFKAVFHRIRLDTRLAEEAGHTHLLVKFVHRRFDPLDRCLFHQRPLFRHFWRLRDKFTEVHKTVLVPETLFGDFQIKAADL